MITKIKKIIRCLNPLNYKEKTIDFNKFILDLHNVEFHKLTYSIGSKTFSFNQDSMFLRSNIVYHILASIDNRHRHTEDLIEREIYKYKLDSTANLGKRIIKLSNINGVTAARDENWKSLKEYGLQLKENIDPLLYNWYSFKSPQDFSNNWGFLCTKNQHVYITEWDERIYYGLCDGSHRLAASYRQDIEQNLNTTFEAEVYQISLNHTVFTLLEKNCLLVILNSKTYYAISELLRNTDYKLWIDSVSPKNENTLLCLPRNDSRSSIIFSKITEIADQDCYFLLNGFFTFNNETVIIRK